MRIVIIGNSATMVGAVEAVRAHDQEAEILVVSEEPHGIYSRPLLDHFLAGEIEKPRLAYRQPDFYSRHHVHPLLDTRIVRVDTASKAIHTESGEQIDYDRLLIATGGTPIRPPMEGGDAEGIFTFTRLDDALSMNEYISQRVVRSVVVVGGGMIGIKVTDALVKRGLKVTMVELAPRILSAAMDSAGAELMTRLLTLQGVDVLVDNTVERVHTEKGHIVGVALRDGQRVAAEMLVLGIGVRPNAELARESEIEVNRGIVADKYMRSSATDVYAAGDVAEAYDLIVDMNRAVAIWPNAYRQGATAGAHMVGVERADPGGMPMNALSVGDVPAMSLGDATPTDDECHVLEDMDERQPRYKRLVIREGRLVGAILIGQISRAGIYTGLIRNKIDISTCCDSLMSEHCNLLSLPTHYRKHVVTGAGIEV